MDDTINKSLEEKIHFVQQTFPEANVKETTKDGWVVWRRSLQEALERPLATGTTEQEAWDNAVINVDDKEKYI